VILGNLGDFAGFGFVHDQVLSGLQVTGYSVPDLFR
jgi:hypothetical protein